MFLAEPPPTQYDVRFSLFGIPVRIHPFFWLISALLVLQTEHLTALTLLVWVAAVFLAILIHELGHAAMIRAFGGYPRITLHGFGGVASYNPGELRRRGVWDQVAISFAGPAAGFLVAALIVLGLTAAGHRVVVALMYHVIPIVVFSPFANAQLTEFVYDFLFISISWGMINLLPVYPLDGGQISMELFRHYNYRDGVRLALTLSIAVSILIVAVGLMQRDFFVAFMFGYLAFNSYAMLSGYGGRGGW